MADNITLIRQAFERPEWYLTSTAYNIRLRAETIGVFLKSDNVGTILDIGCGDGSLSRGLINPNNKVTLLDASQAMLKIATSQVPEQLAGNVQTINSDFMGASVKPQTFDLVLCVGVLAYVEDRKAFIAKVKSVLKPGGSVIVECTDGAHWVNKLVVTYDRFRRLSKPALMQTIVGPSAQVVEIFEGLGFKLRGSFRYSLPFPVIRKLLSQKMKYRMIRGIFGSETRNTRAWMGNECIYYFKAPSQ